MQSTRQTINVYNTDRLRVPTGRRQSSFPQIVNDTFNQTRLAVQTLRQGGRFQLSKTEKTRSPGLLQRSKGSKRFNTSPRRAGHFGKMGTFSDPTRRTLSIGQTLSTGQTVSPVGQFQWSYSEEEDVWV